MLKDEKTYLNTFSKDEIPLIENNKSLIFSSQNSNQPGSHWISLSRKDNNIFIFDSFGIGHIPKNIYDIYIKTLILLQIYTEFKTSIATYVDYIAYYSVYIKLIVKIDL